MSSLLHKLTSIVASIKNVTKAVTAMQQLVCPAEQTVICALFEKPLTRKEIYSVIIRDRSTKTHVLSRLIEKQFVCEQPDGTFHLTPAGRDIYVQLLDHIHFASSVQTDNTDTSC